LAPPAQAQIAGSLRVDSDYRWRGESLSDGRPALRLGLAWDDAQGSFAGLTVGTARLSPYRSGWQLAGHAGIARRGSGGAPGWELGALATRFTAVPRAAYGEIFAGLLGEGWSLRLYSSPNYYGTGTPSAYLELESAWAPAPGWRTVLHAGMLTWLGTVPRELHRTRTDLRLQVNRALGDAELQIAWTTLSGQALYPYGEGSERRRSAWVAGLQYGF
jgi:hypothetical protein